MQLDPIMPTSDQSQSLAARSKPRRQLVGLTPLIDIVFILLVFFMLVTSFVDWRMINLAPPVAVTGNNQGFAGMMLVEVRSDGRIRLSGETVTTDDLGDRLRAVLSRTPDQRFLVKAGNDVSLQELVSVLDHLSIAGAKAITFARTAR